MLLSEFIDHNKKDYIIKQRTPSKKSPHPEWQRPYLSNKPASHRTRLMILYMKLFSAEKKYINITAPHRIQFDLVGASKNEWIDGVKSNLIALACSRVASGWVRRAALLCFCRTGGGFQVRTAPSDPSLAGGPSPPFCLQRPTTRCVYDVCTWFWKLL